MEYDNEREQEINSGADDTPYQRWLKVKDCDIYQQGECDCGNECQYGKSNLEEDGEDT